MWDFFKLCGETGRGERLRGGGGGGGIDTEEEGRERGAGVASY